MAQKKRAAKAQSKQTSANKKKVKQDNERYSSADQMCQMKVEESKSEDSLTVVGEEED